MSICTSLDLYFKIGPPMSENQLKESQSRVASYHPPRRGLGSYMFPPSFCLVCVWIGKSFSMLLELLLDAFP